MENPKDYLTSAFIGGGTFGTISGYKLSLIEISPFTFPMEVMMKIFATILLSVIGGVFGMLAKDVYIHIIQERVIKYFKK